ncbi:hypothetical protein B296_00052137, partial [Ensete ventricosum]
TPAADPTQPPARGCNCPKNRGSPGIGSLARVSFHGWIRMKMAGSMRAESASSGLDGPNFSAAYHNGQRGAFSGSGLERSGSFRESSENRIMVTGSGTSRNTTLSSEFPSLSQYLSLEPFSMGEQRYPRTGELRRVLGVTVEEHPFVSVQSKALPPIASEDLKRFKASISESSSRARYLKSVEDATMTLIYLDARLSTREDVQAGNQSPLIKGKASRASRIGSGAAMNASSNFLRSSGNTDGWDQAPCINKVQPLTSSNRKRPISTESSSPPVTQWVGQRPQKISRTRRVNVVSPVSNLDESQFLQEGFISPDVGTRLATLDTSGLLVSRGMPSSTHQTKLKLDIVLSPAVLSESEESAAVETKFKDKGVDNFEVENGVQTTLKATTFLLSTKKNKTPPKEEIGDGVRRQGRSGRGSVQAKTRLPTPKEKMENTDPTKPLKNGKLGSERSERFQTFLICNGIKNLSLTFYS